MEHDAQSGLTAFPLRNGGKFYYSPTSPELFLHGCACLRAGHDGGTEDYPSAPPVLRALCEAVDVKAAFGVLYPNQPHESKFLLFPYVLEELFENRRLVPRSLVAQAPDEPD